MDPVTSATTLKVPLPVASSKRPVLGCGRVAFHRTFAEVPGFAGAGEIEINDTTAAPIARKNVCKAIFQIVETWGIRAIRPSAQVERRGDTWRGGATSNAPFTAS